MKRRGSARIGGYATLAAVALVASLVVRRPELAVVAAPFALLLTLGISLAREPQLDASLALSNTRTVEGDEVEAEFTLASNTGIVRLELLLDVPDGIDVTDGDDALAMRIAPGEERVVPLALSCSRWGVYDVGHIELRASGHLRLVVWEQRLSRPVVLKAYPRPELVSRVLSAVETQAFVGNEVARIPGDGIEYADLRDFAPGDRVRSINWRADRIP